MLCVEQKTFSEKICLFRFIDDCHTCHATDLINRDFGTLSDLSEGQLSVVCRTSESHLEKKWDIWNN